MPLNTLKKFLDENRVAYETVRHSPAYTSQKTAARLKEGLGGARVELASEEDFRHKFPECEVGAMPPFGNLYDMPVFADRQLAADDEIAFNACTHTELIRLAYRDFEQLVKPTVFAFAVGG
jgi:Ala-tRNA(Pro) deacylase